MYILIGKPKWQDTAQLLECTVASDHSLNKCKDSPQLNNGSS